MIHIPEKANGPAAVERGVSRDDFRAIDALRKCEVCIGNGDSGVVTRSIANKPGRESGALKESKYPTASPASLIAVTQLSRDVGGSIVMNVPSAWRRNPWANVPSPNVPPICPFRLMALG